MNLRLRLPLIGAALLVAASAWAAGPTKVDPKKFKTTKDGLKYAIIKPGKGAVAKAGQSVTVNYTGWLQSNGQKFDSNADHPQTKSGFSFQLGGPVIQGWNEGVPGMKVGEKRQLVIPASLGYGDQGTHGIPGGATLVFDVELLKVGG